MQVLSLGPVTREKCVFHDWLVVIPGGCEVKMIAKKVLYQKLLMSDRLPGLPVLLLPQLMGGRREDLSWQLM